MSSRDSSDGAASAAALARLPRLASTAAGGKGRLPYTEWRPKMEGFLSSVGLEEDSYMEEDVDWANTVKLVCADAKVERERARQLLTGKQVLEAKLEPDTMVDASSASSSSSASLAKAKELLAPFVARSKKAHYYLMEALPPELRRLVEEPHIPKGYAFGVWDFLEKKFRSTEQDNVLSLWREYVNLRQQPDDSFEEFKARVDAVQAELTRAGGHPPAGLYTMLMLWCLQPRYSEVVRGFSIAGKIKDVNVIDWANVTLEMANFERQCEKMDSGQDEAGRSYALREGSGGAPSANKKFDGSSTRKLDLSKIQCYNCEQFGHFKSDCPKSKKIQNPKKSGTALQGSKMRTKQAQRQRNHSPDRLSEGAGERRMAASSTSAKTKERSNFAGKKDDAARANTDSDDSDVEVEKTYAYAVILGLRSDAGAARSPPASACVSRSAPVKQVLLTSACNNSMASPTESKAKEDNDQRAAAEHLKLVGSALRSTKPKFTRKTPERAPTQQEPPKKTLDIDLRTGSFAVDSGASIHSTGNKSLLVNVEECAAVPVLLPNGHQVECRHVGDLRLSIKVQGQQRPFSITIREVYWHPDFQVNLLSWGCMRVSGWRLASCRDGTYLTTPGGKKVVASTRGRLTILDSTASARINSLRDGLPSARPHPMAYKSADDLLRLHQRLGHPSFGRMLKICKSGLTNGIGKSEMTSAELEKAKELIIQCSACCAGKSHRQALGHRGLERGRAAGQVLHMDTFYITTRDPSTGEKSREYCLLATDGYTEYKWARTAPSKVDIQRAVIEIARNCETLTGSKVQFIFSDNGDEFINHTVQAFCRENGATPRTSPPDTPQLDGVSERTGRTTKEAAGTMLAASSVPAKLGWKFAVQHHVYLWNRTRVGKETGITPLEALGGMEPSVLHVGVFGCDTLVHQTKVKRTGTFDPKVLPGVYLGHDSRRNCASVYMLGSSKVVYTKDVKFREGSFTFIKAVLEGTEDAVDMSPAAADLHLADEDGEPMLPSQRAPGPSGPPESDPEIDDQQRAGRDPAARESVAIAAPAQQRYAVKAIVGKREHNGRVEYEVKWKGYSTRTWEPAAAMQEDAPESVHAYEEFQQQRAERTTRSTKPAQQQLPAAATVETATVTVPLQPTASSMPPALLNAAGPRPEAEEAKDSEDDDEEIAIHRAASVLSSAARRS